MNVELDPRLLDEAVELAGAKSKREAITAALREFVRRRRIERMIERAGKVPLSLSLEELLGSREEE